MSPDRLVCPFPLQPGSPPTDIRSVSSDRLLTKPPGRRRRHARRRRAPPTSAHLLDEAGLRDESVQQAAAVLQREPGNGAALALISGAPAGRAGEPGSHAEVSDDEVLRRLDEELADVVPPRFTQPADEPFAVERTGLRLADVGGMTEVKARLEASLLAPLRNPELGRDLRKSTRGRPAALRPAGVRQDVHRPRDRR